ncbi:MAG: succinate dehydrogenase, hydrophobic membrane anchor protein [Candidatus Marinimicrobia bacterium]|nr:succinate dehydrogenase, hydrophobic membrane anchor protein [Candidatus Neomarinimicrobiota bacterium]
MGNRGRNVGLAFHWYLQRITAIILMIGLFVHFYVIHFTIDRPITFEKVQARLLSPGWLIFDSILLIAVIYHALRGFYNVICDYNPRESVKKIVSWCLTVLGIFLIIYGIYILIPFTQVGGV